MSKAKKAKKAPVMKWHEMKQSTTGAELKAAYEVIGNFQKEMETPHNFGLMTLPVAAWIHGDQGSPEMKAAARWARRLDKVSPEPWAKDALLRLAAHTRCDLQKASVLFVRGIFLGFAIEEANKKVKKTGKKYTEKFWQEELPQTCSDIAVRFKVLPLMFKLDNITLEVTANGTHWETVAVTAYKLRDEVIQRAEAEFIQQARMREEGRANYIMKWDKEKGKVVYPVSEEVN